MSDFSVPDKGYSRHGSCALNLIFTYFFIRCKKGETIVLGDLTYLYMVSHKYLHKLNILFTSHLFLLGLIEVSCKNILRKKYEADLWKINELLNDK